MSRLKLIPEKYKDRLSNTVKIKALNVLGKGLREVPQGQVPLDSSFYVERIAIESSCYQAVVQPGALIRIKGARQMGKSSLLARIIHFASQQGYKTVLLDFQTFDNEIFSDSDSFLKQLCISISRVLGLPNQINTYWDDIFGSNYNFIDYLEQHILSNYEEPLVLAIDEMDKIFKYPEVATDFLQLLRGIHEQSKFSSLSWAKLRLVLTHAEENYFQLDINASPFNNVGFPILLHEFTDTQVIDLSKRHGLNLSNDQVESLMQMFGGHPYLVRVALNVLAQGQIPFQEFLQVAPTERGMYTEHLRRHLLNLEKNPQLLMAMKEVVLKDQPMRIDSISSLRLSSMGLVKFHGNDVIPICELYRIGSIVVSGS